MSVNIDELAHKLVPILYHDDDEEIKHGIKEVLECYNCGYVISITVYESKHGCHFSIYIWEEKSRKGEVYVVTVDHEDICIEHVDCLPDNYIKLTIMVPNPCDCRQISTDGCDKEECKFNPHSKGSEHRGRKRSRSRCRSKPRHKSRSCSESSSESCSRSRSRSKSCHKKDKCKKDSCKKDKCKKDKCKRDKCNSCKPKRRKHKSKDKCCEEKHEKDSCCKKKREKDCCEDGLTSDGKVCCARGICYTNDVKCPLPGSCDFCEELKQLVGVLGRWACNAQIYKCCEKVSGEPGCEKFKCCLYVRVEQSSKIVRYLREVFCLEGTNLQDTSCDFGHNLVEYPLGLVMEKFQFSHIEFFLACLDKLIRRDSCNDLTYIDICRTVCKSTLVAAGYKECVDDHGWILELHERDEINCVKTREIGIIELCCKYQEFFN